MNTLLTSTLLVAARRAATISAPTRARASDPLAYISLRVMAVAMPLGNGSLSTISIWRRRPMATTTPTKETAKTHSERKPQESSCPVIMVRAGMGATRPAEEIEAAELAAVWLMLDSRRPQCGVFAVLCSPCQKA